MSEFTVMQTLEVKHCPSCHMAYAAPKEFFARLLELHNEGRKEGSWTCPVGHGIHYSGEPEIDKVRRERDRLKQETARLLEEKGAEIGARRIAEKEIARQAKRSAAGVCSCCHRTFRQLAQHMRLKHPEAPKPPPVGRQIGGVNAAARMTPEQRRERGRKGAMARWGHA